MLHHVLRALSDTPTEVAQPPYAPLSMTSNITTYTAARFDGPEHWQRRDLVVRHGVQAIIEEGFVINLNRGGAKVRAVEWLKAAVANRWLLNDSLSQKQISAISLAELITWANRTLR